MVNLTNIELSVFIKLFNRGGYVLDFNTYDFDAFTKQSIGLELCNYYNKSKGKSLIAYTEQAQESEVIKLILDLFNYYELHFFEEIKSENEYAKLYQRCQPIAERLKRINRASVHNAEELKTRFSSGYLCAQIDLMIRMQKDNPTEAIGKAKELIESCCKTILEEMGTTADKKWDMVRIVDETVKLLKITPHNIPDTIPEATAMKALLGNLKAIAVNIATLRNSYGSGHGKSANFKGLEERHAKLAVGSSTTLVNFIWDSYERYQFNNGKNKNESVN